MSKVIDTLENVEVLKKINGYLEMAKYYENFNPALRETLEGAQRVIARETHQWIPVQLQEPPEGELILVSIANELKEPWFAVTKRIGTFYEGLGRTRNILGEIAWMPLPKPYEVETKKTPRE